MLLHRHEAVFLQSVTQAPLFRYSESSYRSMPHVCCSAYICASLNATPADAGHVSGEPIWGLVLLTAAKTSLFLEVGVC